MTACKYQWTEASVNKSEPKFLQNNVKVMHIKQSLQSAVILLKVVLQAPGSLYTFFYYIKWSNKIMTVNKALNIQRQACTCTNIYIHTRGDVSNSSSVSQQDVTFTFTAFIPLWRRQVCVPPEGDWVWLTNDWLALKSCVHVCIWVCVRVRAILEEGAQNRVILQIHSWLLSLILRHIGVFSYWKFLKKYKSIEAKLSYFTYLKTKALATSWTSQQKIREKVRQDDVTVHRWKGVMVGVSVTGTRKTVAAVVLYLPCLSLGLSVTVWLSQFELTWCVCISVCLRDYFQGDVIHLSLCHLSNCHKKLYVWPSASSIWFMSTHFYSCKRRTVRSSWRLEDMGFLVKLNLKEPFLPFGVKLEVK